MSVLRATDLKKTYRTVTAVDRVSFRVDRAEIFALLGPNGAGKTTIVRMVMRIIQPDDGSIEFDIDDARPRTMHTGYLPEDRGLFKDIPIARTLAYFGVLHGMTRHDAKRAAREWLDRFQLGDRAGEKLDALSKGNQQKVQFASAVLHRPALAVLDEPFSGLDPVNQDAFLDIIRELRDGGMTVILSAHQMQLVERLADRLLLISRGREILAGTLEDITRGAGVGRRLTLDVGDSGDIDALASHESVAQARADGGERVEVLLKRGASLNGVLATAAGSLEIKSVHSERMSLHDIYVRAVEADTSAQETTS